MSGKINELEQSMSILMDRTGIDEKQVQTAIDNLAIENESEKEKS